MDSRRPERADAARNRQRVLDAAARVVAERGVDGLSPDAVARAAGVGVGTVYRRFGCGAGLAGALLAKHVDALRARTVEGPPPLGPTTPPAERLRAFLAALLDLALDQLPLLLYAEANGRPGDRFRTETYVEHHAFVAGLLTDLEVPDPGYTADVLLAASTPSLLRHQTEVRGMTGDEVSAALGRLVDRVVAGG